MPQRSLQGSLQQPPWAQSLHRQLLWKLLLLVMVQAKRWLLRNSHSRSDLSSF